MLFSLLSLLDFSSSASSASADVGYGLLLSTSFAAVHPTNNIISIPSLHHLLVSSEIIIYIQSCCFSANTKPHITILLSSTHYICLQHPTYPPCMSATQSSSKYVHPPPLRIRLKSVPPE